MYAKWDAEAQRLYDATEKSGADYFRVLTTRRKLAVVIMERYGCDEITAREAARVACERLKRDEFDGD